MKSLQPIYLKLTEEDIKEFNYIKSLIISEDAESRILGKNLFRMSDFYKRNTPSKLYIGYLRASDSSIEKVNIKFLFSDSYPFSPGNMYYLITTSLINALASGNQKIQFYMVQEYGNRTNKKENKRL